MLKRLVILAIITTGIVGCASIKSVDELKTAQDKAIKNAQEAADDADADFNRDFNKDFMGDKALKKIAIVYSQVAWDIGKDLRANGDDTRYVVNPVADLPKAQGVVNAVYSQLKKSFEELGYTVVSPTELAELSATYKALPTNDAVFYFSPTFGQEFSGLGISGSRHIDMMTHKGKLISQISREAGIDAVVGLYINDLGFKGQQTNLNKTFISGVSSEVRFNLLICIGKEQAKEAGVSTGWLGDANHCGVASADFKNQYYLPYSNAKDQPEYQSVLETGYSHLQAVYPLVVKGMITELKEEGL